MPTASNRITGKDFYATFTPEGVQANHIIVLDQDEAGTGSFKIELNGEKSDAITVTAGATSAANLKTGIGTLHNPDGSLMVDATDFAVTGTAFPYTIEFKGANANRYITVRIVDVVESSGLVDPYVNITTQGSGTIVLSADASAFDYTLTTETVEVTSLGEFAAKHISVKSTMNFTLNLYDIEDNGYLYVLQAEDLKGRLTVYEEGRGVGKRWFAFDFIKTEFSYSVPDHEKIEITLSGDRTGEMVTPFGTLQE